MSNTSQDKPDIFVICYENHKHLHYSLIYIAYQICIVFTIISLQNNLKKYNCKVEIKFVYFWIKLANHFG